jgi:hypothetical protein
MNLERPEYVVQRVCLFYARENGLVRAADRADKARKTVYYSVCQAKVVGSFTRQLFRSSRNNRGIDDS